MELIWQTAQERTWKMWKIKQILEADYGCEERLPGEKLKVLVRLENEDGKQREVEVEDEWLVSRNLDEGSDWPEPPVYHGRYNELSDDGSDVYGIAEKAKAHIKKIKKRC